MPQGRKERKQNLYGIQNLYFTLGYLTLLLTGGWGAIMARIVFNAQSDHEGVKIARWYFMTFPKYAQRPI